MMNPDFSKVPVNQFYDYTLVSRSREHAEVRMPLKGSYRQEEGIVQGGIISSLADTTAVHVFYPDLTGNQSMTSIEFKLNFLRPALVEEGDLIARARLVKRGRTVGLCEVEVRQEKRQIATGLFTYLFFEK